MSDDHAQLHRYAATGAEDAFAALVRHYLPLVYGAALRRVSGDVHRAQDVTQLVFTALARNARPLATHPDLAGWLFTTTRFQAAKTLRGERRRAAREQAVRLTSDVMSPEPFPEERFSLQPVLDDALAELRQLDRQVILLRFHRGLRLAAIGALIGGSENAVQKRLDRALEQLRQKLARRGITSSAAAVIAAFEQQAAIALPSGLAATVVAAGVAGGAIGTGIFASGSLVTVSKTHVALAAAAALALTGTLAWQIAENHALRDAMHARSASADHRMTTLKRNFATLEQRHAAVTADVTKLEQALHAADIGAQTSASRPVTDDRARMDAASKLANELRRAGRLQEALDAYVSGYRALSHERGTVWRQILMSSIKRFGETFPPATAALHALRDEALQRVAANRDDREAIAEVAQLNERLGDARSTLVLHDSLPIGHPGRQSLALIAQQALVEARRYHDALLGESFGSMLTNFDRLATRARTENGPGAAGARDFAVKETLVDIEVLTGAGRLAEAKTLTDKLLRLDDSPATRASLERHIARATPAPSP